jgi:hypothetical protein
LCTAARAREALDGWRTNLSSLISLAVRQGTTKRTVQPGAVASIIIGTLEGALMISRLDEDRNALEIARDHFSERAESLKWSTSSSHIKLLREPL